MRAGRSLIRLFLQCGQLPIPPPAVLDQARSPRGARRRATHPESLLVNEGFPSKRALDSRGARRVRQLSLRKGSRKRGFARAIEGWLSVPCFPPERKTSEGILEAAGSHPVRHKLLNMRRATEAVHSSLGR